jgi:hypothetical protein
MKRSIFYILMFILLLTLALPGTAFARGFQDDRIITGGIFTLRSGETLDGNLVIFGGVVTLEEGSRVNGDVVLMGGTLSIDGRVDGNVVGIGGSVSLGESANVRGDLTTIAAALNRDPEATVAGQVITGFQTPFQFTAPTPGRVVMPESLRFETFFAPFWAALWFLFRIFLWAALAMLVVMFLPAPTERVARTIVNQPVLAGGAGLLTAIVAPLLFIAIAITIILIPISLVGVLVLAVAWFFGRIALGLEVGRRLALMLRQDWPLPVVAGIGTFVPTLVVDGANQLIPCVGWILPVLVGILGLGGVLLTRFGSQPYPPDRGLAPRTPPPPAPIPTVPEEPWMEETETGEPVAVEPWVEEDLAGEPPVMPPEDLPGEPDREE